MSISRNSWPCRGRGNFSEALQWGAEIFHTLKSVLKKRGYNTAVGDEGGFAPSLKANVEAIELILEAMQQAGFRAGMDVSIALDPAASEFLISQPANMSSRNQTSRSSRRKRWWLSGLTGRANTQSFQLKMGLPKTTGKAGA